MEIPFLFRLGRPLLAFRPTLLGFFQVIHHAAEHVLKRMEIDQVLQLGQFGLIRS